MRPGPWGRVTHPLAAWVPGAVPVGMSRVSHRAGDGGPTWREGAQDLRQVGWAEMLGPWGPDLLSKVGHCSRALSKE